MFGGKRDKLTLVLDPTGSLVVAVYTTGAGMSVEAAKVAEAGIRNALKQPDGGVIVLSGSDHAECEVIVLPQRKAVALSGAEGELWHTTKGLRPLTTASFAGKVEDMPR